MSQLPTLLLSLSFLLVAPPGDHHRQDPERAAPKRLDAGDPVTVQIGDDAYRGLLLAPLGTWVHLRGDDGARMAFPRETVRWVREGR